MKNVLELHKVALEDAIHLSFFRTIEMRNEIENKTIDGVTPIILLFLAQNDKTISDVALTYVNYNGILTKCESKNGKPIATAVEIHYDDKDGDRLKSIVYLSTNLAD